MSSFPCNMQNSSKISSKGSLLALVVAAVLLISCIISLLEWTFLSLRSGISVRSLSDRVDIFVRSASSEWTFLSDLSLIFLEFFTANIIPYGALVTCMYSCCSSALIHLRIVFSSTPNRLASSSNLIGLFPSTMPHVTPSLSSSLVVELMHQRNNQIADPMRLQCFGSNNPE